MVIGEWWFKKRIKSVGDLKGCWSSTNFGSCENDEIIAFSAEVGVLEKLGEK